MSTLLPDPSRSVVLFDLDGTLSDSAPGILRCLRETFTEYGLPVPPDPELQALVGPPFWDTLPPLIGDVDIDAFIAAYRVHYLQGGGRFETSVFAGVPELLAALRDAGVTLAVATSKAEPQVPAVLDHLGVARYFDVVAGDTPEGTIGGKAGVITVALRRLGDDPARATTLMVGDRDADVNGARAHGLDCLGAGWGYGPPGELVAAGALAVFDTPHDLRVALLGGQQSDRSS